MDRNKIEKIVEDAWKIFCDYYDCKVSEYKKDLKSREEAIAEHWICWDEYDLMLQFGRLFYKELNKVDSNSDIELHLEKNLSKSNFEKYFFASKLPKLKGNLKRAPKVDLMIASEKSRGPLLICGEVKYFHYSVEGMNRGHKTVEQVIEKDLETLSKIKELGIAESVVFIIFDDYYLNRKSCEEITKKLLKSGRYDKKIKILYHDSREKLWTNS